MRSLSYEKGGERDIWFYGTFYYCYYFGFGME
jgi:hypothetical protein